MGWMEDAQNPTKSEDHFSLLLAMHLEVFRASTSSLRIRQEQVCTSKSVKVSLFKLKIIATRVKFNPN